MYADIFLESMQSNTKNNGAMKAYEIKHELAHTISTYLCTECKQPLYVELSLDRDVCTNSKCIIFFPRVIFFNIDEEERLQRELDEREQKFDARIKKMDRTRLVRYVYGRRQRLIRGMMTTGQMDIKEFLTIDDLLTTLNSSTPLGKDKTRSDFDRFFSDYMEFFEHKTFIEDVQNRRIMLSKAKDLFGLKYWNAILDLYRSYGIVNARDPKGPFQYWEITSKVKEDIPLEIGQDWSDHFEQYYDFIIQQKYLLEMYYFTSLQHRYDPTGLDIAVIFGLWLSAKKELETWNRISLEYHYNRSATSVGGNFSDFESQYIASRELAPIVVYDGSSYLFDRYTTLFYALYLIGRNQRKVTGQTGIGLQQIIRKKQETAEIFEANIRRWLQSAGYSVQSQPLVVEFGGEEYEYDVVAVDDVKERVEIVEAKFRDLSPSSLTGQTLVQQELIDPDNPEKGLLHVAIRQQKRLHFMQAHAQQFEAKLGLTKPLNKYKIRAWIVTKHPPLISKYRSVKILVWDSFCSQFPFSSNEPQEEKLSSISGA